MEIESSRSQDGPPPVAQTILVDDHPLFRLGLRALLRQRADVEVMGEAPSVEEALHLARRVRADVALVDLIMPGGNGIELTIALRALQPECKILGLSVITEPVRIAEMLRAGACGYVLKTQPIEEVVTAIRLALGGIRYLPPGISHDEVDVLIASDVDLFERLTRREREIFGLLLRGQSNAAIATALFVSMRTVETHRQRILKKLEVHSIVELLQLATRRGYE